MISEMLLPREAKEVKPIHSGIGDNSTGFTGTLVHTKRAGCVCYGTQLNLSVVNKARKHSGWVQHSQGQLAFTDQISGT